MNQRIVIMAGGTGGHVLPALAVAEEMLLRGWQVSWLGTQKGLESRLVPSRGIEIDWLAVEGIRGKGIVSKVIAIFKLMQACLQALRILKQRKPNVVLGMGGFVAGPGGLMAKILGIPVVIHEQNRIPGTTNRLLAKIVACKILEAFPDSFVKSMQAIWTGNPLLNTFLTQPEKAEWNIQAGRSLRVLVVGGSQGAKVLNDHVPYALAEFGGIEVKHQTGYAMHQEVEKCYSDLGISAEVLAFIDDMPTVYQWADLIICRAGAMTISEVAACGLPSILIPLLNAIDDHQTANANYLTDAGAALLLPQTELNTENLRKKIEQAINSLPAMRQAAKQKAKLSATQSVADICIAEAA
ncbi:undecaprenyldiphospho-muramoylpentapeptide beta-N-acetylglucosaminyltransferase [Methylomonas sp. AM2-LC]|uniref:undecaprenyldiphospho-muramoylpentapeptide beta-N-acetylglucosaminyltransferase n=1 Tax=Methylomonas sp. AM2-LC TaxID=3153301 RepID=UPI003265F617